MNRKDRFPKAEEFRLSRVEQKNSASINILLRAIRQTDGRRAPEIHLLPNGSNLVVVDFDVPPQLRDLGYVSRRDLK